MLESQQKKKAGPVSQSFWNISGKRDVTLSNNVQYVLDGGALLHRIPWARGTSFANILGSYSNYVKSHYGRAVVVFDGYEESSTKDMTHMRRSKGKKSVTVTFTIDMNLTITKEAFLTNVKNKKRFVHFLGDHLEASGCQVFHAKEDADLLIVNKTLEEAERKDAVLVGDDTDLLVLLLHHFSADNKRVFFAPEPKKGSKNRIWDIQQVQAALGSFTCLHLLFLHAFLGCDTTSRLYGVGKGSILKKFKENVELQKAAVVFDGPNSTQAQVQEAREKAFVAIYGGKKSDNLNSLRFKKDTAKK